MHEKLNHFGVCRTHSILQNQYWWVNMNQQVDTYLDRCESCDHENINLKLIFFKYIFFE
jgi:hypothetical protein